MEEIPLAADPFPALPELLRRPAGYRSTVLGQSPVGYWMLDDDSGGMLTNEIANEDDDAFLSSSRSIAAGRWHQVLASWGPSSVGLFIDGQLVARDSGKRTLKEGNFCGRYVRFGKPSRDLSEDQSPFTGWVDEIVLWDRPLSGPEVTIQFRAARGRVDD